jgi:bifunctional ADP-heptose synthase (sugar kinase/adenylyltransferase)
LFLDSRSKIIPLHEIKERLQGHAAQWVSGHFDPLLAPHVGRLGQAREPGKLLVVEVTNPARPLLSQRARAELVAALAMVDYVVLGAEQPAADSDLTEHFINHVLEVHRQEARAGVGGK